MWLPGFEARQESRPPAGSGASLWQSEVFLVVAFVPGKQEAGTAAAVYQEECLADGMASYQVAAKTFCFLPG